VKGAARDSDSGFDVTRYFLAAARREKL
jgi:hypothetical protein